MRTTALRFEAAPALAKAAHTIIRGYLTPPVHLTETLDIGLERGRDLLTAGELALLDRIRALSPPAERVFALLCARVDRFWPDEKLPESPPETIHELFAADLLDRLVPWSVRLHLATIPELVEGCRRLGLRTTGTREHLASRLEGHSGWSDRPWVRLLGGELIRRLERFSTLRIEPDPGVRVLERMGRLSFVDYPRSTGSLFADRASMRAWESVVDEPLDVDRAIEALQIRAPGGLDPGHRLRRAIAEHAEAAFDAGHTAEARRLWTALGGHEAALRIARTHEAEGAPEAALQVLITARTEAKDEARLAVSKAARRVAKTIGRGIAPDPPLQPPRERLLRMDRGETLRSRPTFRVRDEQLTVEDAAIRLLQHSGRVAVHVEGSLWSTLSVLLLADALFLPIHGALPVPRLGAPLDLGTRHFELARRGAIEAIRRDVFAGNGSDRIREAHARLDGRVVHGAAWNLSLQTLIAVSDALGPAVWLPVEQLIDRGLSAFRGMPDLAILPGPPARLDAAVPAAVPPGLVLAEIKSEGDVTRDAQAVWFDRFARAGVTIERWSVRPR